MIRASATHARDESLVSAPRAPVSGDVLVADDGANLAWAETTWADLDAAEGSLDAFPGFAGAADAARVTYGDNRARPDDLEATYDPENVLGTPTLGTPRAETGDAAPWLPGERRRKNGRARDRDRTGPG